MKRNRRMLALAAGTAVVVLAATAAVADEGAAVAQAPPGNQSPPTISGSAEEGNTLTADEGRWTGQPTSFAFSWRRCDRTGGSCSEISGATRRTYSVQGVDVGDTLRVRVTATNQDGSTSRTSVPTAVVTEGQRPGRGCDANAPLQVQNISAPDRLQITPGTISPSPVTRSTRSITVRFRVTCEGKPVQGALLNAAAVPFNQFSSAEQPTGADGSVQLAMSRQRGFPAARQQQLLVIFARARKPGENPLGGISTRRLVSFRVNLGG